MKITLYLENKIIEFMLPEEISGSYSFDENTKSDSKLINIEAYNDNWYIYSTTTSKIMNGNTEVDKLPLTTNTFYFLKKENKIHVIYISNSKESNVLAYSYNNNSINLMVGNTDKSTVKCNNSISQDYFYITCKENKLILTPFPKNYVYINNKRILSETIIKLGDKISSYGIDILIINNLLFIVSSKNNIKVKERESNIKLKSFTPSKENLNLEIKDRDLYEETSYFSKSPRLRRFIEKKELQLEAPPQNNKMEDMPMLLTVGPMLTMGASSSMMLVNTIMRVNNGQTTYQESWPQLVMSGGMLMSTLLWPTLTKLYQKHREDKLAKNTLEKYNKYLAEKEQELIKINSEQSAITKENLVSLDECLNMIKNKITLFWNKRTDENDFLLIRVGTGNKELEIDIKYPEQNFTIEENQSRKQMENLINKYKYINNIPIGYSLYDNTITAIMGNENKSYNFVNNIILQLITFYSYDDIKLVFFTSKENEMYFEYAKYLKHTFSNDLSFRFFASNQESYHTLSEYLNIEINKRLSMEEKSEKDIKPHYIIIIDNYEDIKKFDFVNTIAESEKKLGISIILLENSLSKLPSKCNNFISLTGSEAAILKNSFEHQEQITFHEEIKSEIDMMEIAKIVSNIPIEFDEGIRYLPNSISFLEMERVGKVEQLNILNRWKTNDPTISLKAEVGVDELGNLMYLDLHEKYHGPHGLIAGTTGSGKSEFIITYVLSMAINYSPEYVSFILIDYKGGGLAFAFENKLQGIVLPHLAGTITNLDKAEMDRTLVSIDSETKRRQKIFNEAREKLGESTIDIYKYQSFYKEGKVTEPLPHLFIICDEFAELKAQQPEFMDNLISIARIGRSLGVHLILATQKPSGVVNDQIWSNTKFRVCLKVQDESDSKEMLKRTEAAHIKQTGRFYLQVGYDEYFALGQSGWCGAKYYPSNEIVKSVDKSINVIDDCGTFIKSMQSENTVKKEAQGEQLSAIMKNIISIAQKENVASRKLWLDNIPKDIYINNLYQKYQIKITPYNIEAVVGEYDAPELQEQGVVKYRPLEDGNTIIYGIDSFEKEMLLSTIIYSTVTCHLVQEINYYIIDYGSESLMKFSKFPHIGGIVLNGEEEKFNNLIKMLNQEQAKRKKLFSNYGGEYKNYILNNNQKLPLIVVILNNYDSIYESHNSMYEYLPEMIRDSERLGIIYILTANASNSVSSKVSQNFANTYAFRIKDPTEYLTIFNSRKKIILRDIIGRGILNNGSLHQFQVAKIAQSQEQQYLEETLKLINQQNVTRAKKIPTLPEIVNYDFIKEEIKDMSEVPIGISKEELEIVKYNFEGNTIGTIISSNKLENIKEFIKSLTYEFVVMPNTDIIFIDATEKLQEIKQIVKFYYSDFSKMLNTLIKYFETVKIKQINKKQMLIIYGFDKAISDLVQSDKFEKLINAIKLTGTSRIIIVDDASNMKTYVYEKWFNKNFDTSDGIWIGKGISDQSVFKLGMLKREFMQDITNNYGMYIQEKSPTIIKLIDFYRKEVDENGK